MVKGCYCDEIYEKCSLCREEDTRKENLKICESWNWNKTPRECATEANLLGWTHYTIKAVMAEFGFKPNHVNEVLYEFEQIS